MPTSGKGSDSMSYSVHSLLVTLSTDFSVVIAYESNKKNHNFHPSCIAKTHDLQLEIIETEREIAEELKGAMDKSGCILLLKSCFTRSRNPQFNGHVTRGE